MLIGARSAAWGGGKPTINGFLAKGLVAYWDGIDNTGHGHDDTFKARIVDLSGNGNDGICFYNNSQGGNFTDVGEDFIRVNGYYHPVMLGGLSSNGICTVEMTVDVVESEYNGNIIINPTSGVSFVQLRRNGNTSRIRYTLASTEVYDGSQTGTLQTEGKARLTLVLSKARIKSYRNGIMMNDKEISSTVDLSGTTIVHFFGYGCGPNVKIHCVQIYDRELSQPEVSENYNASVARFGLA